MLAPEGQEWSAGGAGDQDGDDVGGVVVGGEVGVDGVKAIVEQWELPEGRWLLRHDAGDPCCINACSQG